MKLDILCIKNKGMGCWSQPWFVQSKLENEAEGLARSLTFSKDAREKYKKCALYHLGTFDDVACKYDLLKEPALLLDCDDIVSQIPEEISNGK